MRLAFLLLAAISLLPSPALAEEWQGKVVGVADGDTLTVLRDKTPVKIRLQAVDCPEKAQPFGTKAKQFTSEMVFGKIVTVKVASKDRYGRTVAWVAVDGKSLNEELLRAGMAWHYRQYDKSEKLTQLEQEARAAKRGLWADSTPTPPWEWRREGNVARLLRADSNGKGSKVSGVIARLPAKAGALSGRFHGNTKSKVFHGPGCKGYDCRNCTAVFKDRQDAVNAGYRPHPQCASQGEANAPAAGTPQPRHPWREDRACRADADCVLLPIHSPCACSPCGRVSAEAANKKALETLRASWARMRCQAPICPACAPLVVGDKALCINGQCQAR
jgi:micrococcal nuclease